MNAGLIVRILWERRCLRSHERFTLAELEAFQARRLGELRRHAYARSAFYRRFQRAFEGRPLAELPALSKTELMTAFDEVVTAPEVRLAEVERHLSRRAR